MTTEECEHAFCFLRQEERNDGHERNPVWVIEDTFFCSKCLTYRRVNVARRQSGGDGTSYLVRLN